MTGHTPARETWWTAERVTELCALIAEGLSYRLIGERLGTTKNAALSKAKRLRVVRRVEGPAPRTLHDRMDAEHARMDAMLAECAAAASRLVESKRGRSP